MTPPGPERNPAASGDPPHSLADALRDIEGEPDRPEFLSEIAAAEWDRVVSQIPGIIDADHVILEQYCETYAEVRELREHAKGKGIEAYLGQGAQGQDTVAPLGRAIKERTSMLRDLAAQLGLTPTGRRKLPAPKVKRPPRAPAPLPNVPEGEDPRSVLGSL